MFLQLAFNTCYLKYDIDAGNESTSPSVDLTCLHLNNQKGKRNKGCGIERNDIVSQYSKEEVDNP